MAGKFDAYFDTLIQNNVAKAGSVLEDVGSNPDQAAEQRTVGKELGVNPFLVSTDPDFYKGLMARKKATTALSQAPKTAQWMQNPENAALAGDDVETIGALEAIGNSMSRFGYGWLQSYNQQRAMTSKRIADDTSRSFDEITYNSRTPIYDEAGKEVGREPLGPVEALGAANRWAVARIASVFGLESEIAAEAEDFQISAGYYAQQANQAKMTAGAEAVREKIGSFKPSGSMLTDLTNFAAIVGEDPAGFMSFLAQVGLESAPNMLASAAVMAATRNVFAGASVAGATSGLMERGRAPMEVFEDAGYDMSTLSGIQAAMADQEVMQKAAERGDTRGLIIGLMDAASAGVAGQVLSRSVAGNFLLQSLAQSVFGGGGEAAAQVATGEEFNLAEVLVEALAEFITAPLEVASMGGAQLPKLARRFGRSGETSDVLSELDQLAANSKLRQRAPDKFIEALNAQGFENAEVYVPAEAVREYFQREGIEFDADLMEAWGVSADAWEVADATNGDIGIPISVYAANLSGTPAGEMILRNGMLNPDEEMSASDAERFNAEWRDIMEQELREIEDRRALELQLRTDAEQIRDDLFGQLRAAGHIPDVAEAETALWVSAFEQAAQLSGENALTLWNRYRVRVLGEASAGMVRRRNQLDADLNTIRAAGVKKGQTAQQQVATARKQMLEQFPELKSKRPFTQAIIARGGVAPGSPAAAELAARGVTVQSAPGLFRKGGMTDLDNIIASEIFLSPVLPEDGNGYLSPDGVLDAIAQEGAGQPVPFSAEAMAAMEQLASLEASLEAGEVRDAPATYAEWFSDGMLGQLAATLDAQGVDLDALSNDEIAAMLGLGDVRPGSPAADGMRFEQAPGVETPAFKAWFGDSKVVDDQGKPLVVYHGTQAEFDAFDTRISGSDQWYGRGSYFATDRNSFEEHLGYNFQEGDGGGRVVEAYLSIQNPYIWDVSTDEGAAKLRDDLAAAGVRLENDPAALDEDGDLLFDVDPSLLKEFDGEVLQRGGSVKFREWAEAQGYDGVFVKDYDGGNIPVEIVAFHPEQIKSVNNRGDWDASDARILYQSAIENDQPLYVTHNLSAEKLRHAADLGGLAAPSLAVARGDIGFDDFGEISLIGDPSMADPKSKGVRAFNADVYSPRQPRAMYKVPTKAYDAMRRVLNPIAEKYGFRIRFDQSDIERGGLAEVIGTDVAKAAWLESKRETVPVVFEDQPAPEPVPGYDRYTSTDAGELAADPAFVAKVQRKKELAYKIFDQRPRGDYAMRNMVAMWGERDAPVSQETISGIAEGVAARNAEIAEFKPGKTDRIDTYRTGQAIDAAIAGREAEYNAWVQKQFGDILGAAFFENSAGQKKAYTLTNIVREMTRTIRNGENWNYGAGNVRAAVAPEFKSLKEVQAARGQITDSASMEKLKDEVNGELLSLADEFGKYSGGGDRFGWVDDFSDFLRDVAIGPRAVSQWPWAKDVPADVMQKAADFLEKLKGLPTYYFEIKMQRAVGLNEFAAAVVPSNLPADARKILTDAGLELIEYPNGESRVEAVRSIGERVFFQRENAGAFGSVQFPAGGIGRGESVIQLFEGANLSTFLHESGHFFLELYGELAAQPGASPELVSMMDTLRDWLGAKPGEQFTTEQHEKFARGFEAYLMEGNAPSVELADAFARFRAWLSRVYQSLKSLRVNLTPEVRSVMDRMLASDAAIAEARAAYQVSPMFADRGPVGMSEQDWRTYQRVAQREQQKAEESALKKMMAVKLRETKAWYKEAKEATTKEVTREFSTRRNFRAVSVMASKSWLDPANTMEVPDIRIDRAALVEIYGGDGILQEISKHKLGGGRAIYAKDGAHPQVVADMFGYASVKEMIEDLQNTPKLKDAIRAEVERRMVEQYGDPLSDGSIEEMAIQALHNEAKEQRDMIELRSIGRRIGKPEPRSRIFKLRARAMIGAMSVREASKPQAFLRAERKAAAEAQAAFAAVVRGGGRSRESLEAAYAAKEREILNHFLYKEARDFEQAVRRGRERFRSYSSPRVRQAIGSPHIERIDDLLETYEFRAKSERWVSNREGLKAYIEAMTAEGREGELSIDPDVAAQADRTHYTRMKVDEFYGLIDTVKNIEAMGRLKDKLRTAQKERSEKATIDGIKDAFKANVKRRPRSREKDAAFSRRRLGRDVMNWTLNADTLLREIDGFSDMGAAWSGIKEDVDAGLSRLEQRKVEVAERFNELFSVYTDAEKRDMAVKRPNTALGGDFSKWSLIVMALNSGNRDNWQRLTNPDAPGTFNEAALNNALSALDERDWRFVQSMMDYIGSFWGEIAAKEQRQTGIAPKKVDAEVMTSAAPSWFQGGYYPIKYDSEISGRADDLSQQAMADQMRGGRMSKAATRKGHTKERKATARQPVNLDIGQSLQHVNDVIYDIELGEAVSNSWRVLRKLKDTFFEYGRQSDYDALESWIKDVAAGERSAAHGFGKVMQLARTGFTFSRLGMNLVTVALQPTGIAQSFVTIGKGAMMRGLATYARNPGRWADDIVAASPMMAERQRSFQRDLHDLMGRLDSSGMTGGRWAKLQREYLVPLSFYLMQKVQFFTVDAPTWVAAYEKALAEGKAEDGARTYADLMVKRSQGSGLISDRGMLERGKFTPTQEMNEMPKLLTALGSYMFAKFNVAYERTMATNWRSPLDAMLWAADMAILFALEAALGMVVRGSLPDDDEPFWEAMLKETGLSVMGTVPFVRDAASGLQGFSSGGSAASIIDLAMVRPMLEAASLASEDGEFDRKTITTAIDAFGIWFNLPSAQVNRMIKAMLEDDLSRSDKGLIDLLGFGQGDGQTIFEYLGSN